MEGGSNGSASLKENNVEEVANRFSSADFPAGLRVLVVDDDRASLVIVERMLRLCRYKVTTCCRPDEALSIVRKHKSEFDILLIDLHMPSIDGIKLLEIVKQDMDSPVVLMSGDEQQEVVLTCILHGACDYLIKPLRMEALKLLWQHVVRKKNANALKEVTNTKERDNNDHHPQQIKQHCTDHINPRKEENTKDVKRKRVDAGGGKEVIGAESSTSSKGKKRMTWTKELREKFVIAYNRLGHERAVPLKLLECMRQLGVTDISRENVASHLQKFRMHMRKQDESPVYDREILACSGMPNASTFDHSNLQGGYAMQGSAATTILTSPMPQCINYPQTMVASSSINLPVNNQSNLTIFEATDLGYYTSSRHNSYESRNDAIVPQPVYDPSLFHQLIHQDDVLDVSFVEQDGVTSLAPEDNSKGDWQSFRN